MIELAGGITLGLAWGWLLAQRFAVPRARAVVALAAAALAGEAALLAGRGSAAALLAASVGGALLRTAFSRAVASRQAPA